MTRQDLESVRKSIAAVVKDICAQYGLHGNAVYYTPSPFAESSRNRMFIVAGLDSLLGEDTLPKNLYPDEIFRAIQRNNRLFYPHAFALDLLVQNDQMAATQSLVEYCKKAQFISQLYGEYGLPMPKVLRESEVYQLINFRVTLDNPNASSAMKQKARKDLDWFFRREKSKSKFRQKWLRYFRSEKFPDDKGPIAKLRGYFRRDENTVSLEQLMDTNTDVSKLEMQEFEFRIFQDLLQKRYPFVTYAVGDKSVVDHGINSATRRDDSPFGKCVTAEEYAVVRKDRFAEEGWDCVANLKPAYWEFRDIYYKDCDEPLIASLYHHITLQYAKCDSLGDMKRRGPLKMQNVPVRDFMNFVSLAKANKLHFYIDTLGDFETPSLETVHVVYNEYQEDKMKSVVSRMLEDTVAFSHVLEGPVKPSLNSRIRDSKNKGISEQQRLPKRSKSLKNNR